jgi:hypothetical protein
MRIPLLEKEYEWAYLDWDFHQGFSSVGGGMARTCRPRVATYKDTYNIMVN